MLIQKKCTMKKTKKDIHNFANPILTGDCINCNTCVKVCPVVTSSEIKKHIRISSFNLENGHTTGKVIKDEIELNFDIYFNITKEYFLVYALEKN